MTLEELIQQFNNLKNEVIDFIQKVKDHRHLGHDFHHINYGDLDDVAIAHGTVYLSGNQSNNGTIAKVTFNTELFTTEGITWDSVNSRFTVTEAGKYLVTSIVYWGNPAVTNRYASYIYKTGTVAGRSQLQCSIDANDLAVPVHRIVSLAVGNYIEIFAGHTNGPTSHNISGTETYSYMSIAKV